MSRYYYFNCFTIQLLSKTIRKGIGYLNVRSKGLSIYNDVLCNKLFIKKELEHCCSRTTGLSRYSNPRYGPQQN